MTTLLPIEILVTIILLALIIGGAIAFVIWLMNAQNKQDPEMHVDSEAKVDEVRKRPTSVSPTKK